MCLFLLIKLCQSFHSLSCPMFKFQSCLLKTFPLPFAKWCTKSPYFSFGHCINFSKGFLMCTILAIKVCSQHLSFKDSLGVINLYHVVDIIVEFVHKDANPIKLHCEQEVNDMFIKNIPMFQKRLTLNFSIHLFAQSNLALTHNNKVVPLI